MKLNSNNLKNLLTLRFPYLKFKEIFTFIKKYTENYITIRGNIYIYIKINTEFK